MVNFEKPQTEESFIDWYNIGSHSGQHLPKERIQICSLLIN